jgi:hypothetical protein
VYKEGCYHPTEGLDTSNPPSGKAKDFPPLSDVFAPAPKPVVSVYMDDGRVFSYPVHDAAKAREHASAIIATGYRHNDGKEFEHYPPHRILKVKVSGGVPTNYTDTVTGT